jgi:membrane-bound serine protease (ClpP class)
MFKTLFKYSLLIVLPFTFMCNLCATPFNDNKGEKIIYSFEINEEIGPAATRITEQAIEEAENMAAKYIILRLNTYGGLVDDADNIRTLLLNTKIPTIVFIENNAASAGALISIACDSIYMKEGATIGAAAVVNAEGEIMPEKYQSYMRNKMRATAEATNRNPDIAEGMVDPNVEINGVSKKGEIITFSVNEAIKNNYCIAKAETIADVIRIAKLEDYTLYTHKVSFTEKIIAFFINPAVSGLLLLLIIGGIYFELQSPGIGFPLAAAIIGAILYFMPHYLEGLAANWEILVFIIGLVLIAIEVFVIPGFGFTGILGITLIVSSLILSLVRNIDGLDFSFVPKNEMGIAFLTVSVVLMASVFSIFFGGDRIVQHFFSNSKLGLNASEDKADGYIITEAKKNKLLIGEIALAQTDLRPSGKILFQNEWLEALSDGEFVSKGSEVKIIGARGAYVLVEKIN